MGEDTTLVSAKVSEATLVTRLQEQGGKLELEGEILSLSCCVFLSSFKLMREDTLLVFAKGTEATLVTGLQEQGGQVGPRG